MENTLISHEHEEMRSQISLLKEKLDKQSIINEEHIRRSMKSKISDINRIVTATIFMGVFALIYCTVFFYIQGLSILFVVATAVMLTVCVVLTIMQKVSLGRMDLSRGSLVDTARKLGKVRTHYADWYKIAIPMITVWLGWLIYEILTNFEMSSSATIGFLCGACVGVVIGGIAGARINRKVVAKANDILNQIEELQKEE